MKNQLICTLTALFLVSMLSACTLSELTANQYSAGDEQATVNAETANKSTETFPAEFNDMTVLPQTVYDQENITKDSIASTVQSLSDVLLAPDLETMIKHSTTIIRGTIMNVSYTFIDGMAWTQANVCVEESLAGSLTKGDIISVYYLGGYVSAKDYIDYYGDAHFAEEKIKFSEKSFFKFVVDEEKDPDVGESNLYFLTATPEFSPLPRGVYERVCGKYASFSVSSDGETVARSITDVSAEEIPVEKTETEEIYSYNAVKELISTLQMAP